MNNKNFNKNQSFTPSLEQRIKKKFSEFLKLPKKVFDRYAGYNAGISEMFNIIDDHSLHEIRVRNAKLVNIFIILPIILGITIFAIHLYLNRYDFLNYYKNATSAILYNETTSYFNIIGLYLKKIYYILFNFPLGLKILKWLPLGYLGSILGAWLLNKHTAFQQEEKIQKTFAALGYIDINGLPWKVVWTPNVIMITAFNCDPDKLVDNNRFWNSINFPPSNPKKLKSDNNKFIVRRRYELPISLVFEVSENSLIDPKGK